MQQTINIPEGFELIQTSETTFEIKEKKRKLPKTWKEFCDTHCIKEGEAYIDNWGDIYAIESTDVGKLRDSNLLPTISDAEGILALMQLIQLRDCYNDGWRADWDNNSGKYVITRVNNEIVKEFYYRSHAILSFKSRDLQEEFYSNFKDLIEIAKDFI